MAVQTDCPKCFRKIIIFDSLRTYEKREPFSWFSLFSHLLFVCPTVTDYRTFVDDMYKVLEFVQWYEEWN